MLAVLRAVLRCVPLCVTEEINSKWETIYNIYGSYNCQYNWFSDNAGIYL